MRQEAGTRHAGGNHSKSTKLDKSCFWGRGGGGVRLEGAADLRQVNSPCLWSNLCGEGGRAGSCIQHSSSGAG